VVQRALAILASVLADSGAPGADRLLDEARALWPGLARDERAALAPLAKLAADRVQATARLFDPDVAAGAGRGGADAVPGAGAPGADDGAYLAHLADMEASIEPANEDASGAGPPPGVNRHEVRAPTGPPPARHPLTDATPEGLLALLGLSAFRPGQRDAVQSALDGRDSLVVMPTGGGKSLCYQLPALAGSDLTVVVSPLIALMRDQCARLTDLGHPAVMLASGGDGEANRRALDAIREGSATVCFAAPERFASGAFRSALARRAIALFVVDEAHCVSEWGHDFRPDYLRLASVIDELGRPPVMACTATATPKVAEEIVARLALREPERVRSRFDRPNLSFDVLPFDGEGSVARKRATLVAGLGLEENRPAVVYCGTRKSTEEIAELLGAGGLRVAAYHAGMPADIRSGRQDAFMRGEAEVVVATNAFGMGVDKADVRSVWHWALPSSLEAYYQEAGRAGRDGLPARAVLLASRSDLGRLVRFIREAEVTVDQVSALVGRLRARAQAGGSVELDAGDDRDRIALAVAERAGALTLAPGGGARVRAQLLPDGLDRGRAAALCRAATNRRWESYRSIERYATGDGTCRRRQLLDHFGDPSPAAPEGRCCDVDDAVDWLPQITVTASRRTRNGGSGGSGGAPVDDGPPVAEEDLAPLKAWRRDRAEGKPAYTVATDATLREVVRRRPQSPDELLSIKGIGPSFVTKHADSLLELLGSTA
jgi:ATP-dependent DNA helicase RecQ